MSSADRKTARGIVLRGSLTSSANGSDASKPMKERIAQIIPGNTEPQLFKLPVFGPKTESVLLPPAATTSVTASARNTTISKVPSATPVRVERRMPRYVRNQTIRPAPAAKGAQSQVGQPKCDVRLAASSLPKMRYSSGATIGSASMKPQATRKPT